jgi:uncharacterized protein YuzE
MEETTYDKNADAMYITLVEKWPKGRPTTLWIDRNTLIDIDGKKRVLGIELLNVKKRKLKVLEEIPFKDITDCTTIGNIQITANAKRAMENRAR